MKNREKNSNSMVNANRCRFPDLVEHSEPGGVGDGASAEGRRSQTYGTVTRRIPPNLFVG